MREKQAKLERERDEREKAERAKVSELWRGTESWVCGESNALQESIVWVEQLVERYSSVVQYSFSGRVDRLVFLRMASELLERNG